MASTTISATVGVHPYHWLDSLDWKEFGSIWRTWWLGDGVGAWL
jgi:integral membrane sensor domain MASE1